MEKTTYYRFESGTVILRRRGDRVEKFGSDGVWTYKPQLISYLMNGEEGLERISEEEAMRFVAKRRGADRLP